MDKQKVTYITCSSYSGSTLLSFLLNDHPEITTVGHLTGWPKKFRSESDGQDFRCSCGAALAECPFFDHMGSVFDRLGLPHEVGDFSTDYRLVENGRFNRYLLSALPKMRIAALETLRDRTLGCLPAVRRRLATHDRANVTFISEALKFADASVFLDNSHRPYRLRLLARIKEFDLSVIHLTRDFRGVVNSTMRRRNWPAALTMNAWLQEQVDCERIASGFPHRRNLYYEDLCNDLEGTLAGMHRFCGLEPEPFSGDLGTREHHILGNMMRLKLGKVAKDSKWRDELEPRDLNIIVDTAKRFIARNRESAVAAIVRRYLEEDPGA